MRRTISVFAAALLLIGSNVHCDSCADRGESCSWDDDCCGSLICVGPRGDYSCEERSGTQPTDRDAGGGGRDGLGGTPGGAGVVGNPTGGAFPTTGGVVGAGGSFPTTGGSVGAGGAFPATGGSFGVGGMSGEAGSP